MLSVLDQFTPDLLRDLSARIADTQPSKLGKRKCKMCKSQFVQQTTLVAPTTWFLPFGILNENERPTVWPTTLSFEESDRRLQSDEAIFDLGYISYSSEHADPTSTAVTHHTSLHYFGGQWYYYDDMNKAARGRLVAVANPDVYIAAHHPILRAVTVVYFRRNPPNVAECQKKQ